jgi:hypothetical protein
MSLKGGPALKRRLKALKTGFKDYGRAWANGTVQEAKPKVPVATGKLRRSIRVRNANQRRATVVANYTAYFVDKGPKAHIIRAKRAPRLIFQAGGRTIFAKSVNHRGYRGRPFRHAAALASLRKNPMAAVVIKAWNQAT